MIEIKKKKTNKNQKCNTCGDPMDIMLIISPTKTRNKEWRVCENCFKKLFKGNKNET